MPRSSLSRLLFRRTSRRLPLGAIAVEATGFLVIVCTIWLNELLDLPHHFFGAPASPFRPHEAILESGLVLVWGAVIVALTVRLVRHLDSLIVLCAWCHRARQDSTWTSIEEFLAAHSAETSHGMCPECTARFEADLAKAA